MGEGYLGDGGELLGDGEELLGALQGSRRVHFQALGRAEGEVGDGLRHLHKSNHAINSMQRHPRGREQRNRSGTGQRLWQC